MNTRENERSGASRVGLMLAALSTVFVVGILSMPSNEAIATVRNAEDLLIVDCLLPGQVRKLGSATTFMSARRPIRTTQADCEIRGGEFVSYDRANYQTALHIWQGQAEAGDAQAQNYVGEIYQKGLGVTPDYAMAASWFEKAAAQGFKRAKINLGYLYEQGLGVAQDLPKALNFYREASGISGDELVFASTVSAKVEQAQTEIADLRQQVQTEQERSQRLRQQIDQLKQQLSQKRANYQKTEQELKDARAKLDGESKKLGVQSDPQYAKLQKELSEREQALNQERQALQAEQNANAKKLADAQAKISALQSREEALKSHQSATVDNSKDLEDLRTSAAQLNVTLGEARERMQALETKLTKNEEQRQAEQANFDRQRTQLAAELSKNEESKKLLRLMEQQLNEKRQELSAQREQMASLQAQIDSGKPTVTPTGTALTSNGVRVEILQPALSLTRGQQPAASVGKNLEAMEVVGRVQAPGGLSGVTVNELKVTLDAAGMFKTRVAVAADGTPVHVAAIDQQGQKAALDFMLIRGAGGAGATSASSSSASGHGLPHNVQLGKFYALVIGNDQYPNYPGLKSAVTDASAVAQVLKANYGYDTHLLKNANRFEILSALNDMREQLKDSDNLLVYFAGHGELDAQTHQGYWLPVDAQPNQASSWISNRAISDILTTMQARHVMVIADSCYSGTMTRTALASFDGAMPDSAWGNWVKTMSDGRSRTALTSGGVQPVPDSSAKGEHSLFAGALLAVLGDNNQLLTGQRLFREVASSMALKETTGSNLLQSPEYAPIQYAGHEAGEFFFQPVKQRLAVVM